MAERPAQEELPVSQQPCRKQPEWCRGNWALYPEASVGDQVVKERVRMVVANKNNGITAEKSLSLDRLRLATLTGPQCVPSSSQHVLPPWFNPVRMARIRSGFLSYEVGTACLDESCGGQKTRITALEERALSALVEQNNRTD